MQVHVIVPQSLHSGLQQLGLVLSRMVGVERRIWRLDGQPCEVYTLILEDGKGQEFSIGEHTLGLWSELDAPLLTVPIWLGAILLPSLLTHLERYEARGRLMYLYFKGTLSKAVPVTIPFVGSIYLATGALDVK